MPWPRYALAAICPDVFLPASGLGLHGPVGETVLPKHARAPYRRLQAALLRLLLAGLLVLGPGLAQAAALHGLRFNQLGSADGLPGSGVVTMLQDSRGLVWVGTGNGLARFDGRHFKVWEPDPEQPGKLSHGLVHSLMEDRAGQAIWVGTRTGLDRIDLRDDSLRRIAMPKELALQDQPVLGLAPAGPQRLWVATPMGLFLLDPASGRFERWQAEGWAQPQDEQRVRSLLADGQGGIWLAQGHRVVHIDAQGRLQQQLNTLQGSPTGQFSPVELLARRLAFDREGRLWVGLSAGLQLWRIPADGRSAPQPEALPEHLRLPRAVVHSLLLDQDGAMWIGVGASPALHRWRAGQSHSESFVHLPGVSSSLAGDSVASLMQDRSGTLWVGTWGRGISLTDLAARGFSSYLEVPGDPRSLSNEVVMATLLDGPEHAWLGTYGGGLNRVHLPSGDTERIDASAVPLKRIKAMLAEPDGRLWLGGDGGLLLYDPRRGRSQAVELGHRTPAGASISALLRDRQGQVWAGSAGGLYRLDRERRLSVFRSQPGQAGSLSHDVVDCLLEDRDGRLWVGSKGGLQLWDAEKQQFSQPVLPSADMTAPGKLPIFGMRQDAQGRIWLATEMGLYQLLARGEAWEIKSWRELPGMPKGEFSAIQDALNGEIWLSNEQGLTRVQPERRQARFYPGRSRFGGGFAFGSAARGPDGSLYFGGPGLLRFQPEALRDNPTPPQLVLSDVLILNRSVRAVDPVLGAAASGAAATPDRAPTVKGLDGPLHLTESLQLSHHETMVSFELAALHFNQRQLLRYAWKLEGFDRDWIYGIGDLGLATYTNLDPGRYRLLAKAANPDGLWSESRVLLELAVQPPFWRSWWWRAGMVGLFLLAMALAYRLRVRVLQQSRQRLSELVEQRTEQLQEQQQQLAREKQAADAQREVAEKARRDIGLLSEIGRQITASLDVAAIQQTLYRHVNELVDCSVFGVGLVDWQARQINFDFVMQRGQAFKPYQRSLDGPGPAAQCALQARELNLADLEQDNRVLQPEGAAPLRAQLQSGAEPDEAHSGLYVPMMLKGEVLGVISALSPRLRAFGAADLDILRTLGAYAAVALDNAEAYRRLQITQNQLVEQEKLAALGSLVAGVAHELNTPIGNSLLMASTLSDSSKRFLQQVQSGALRRSELERFCQTAEESSQLLVRSLGQAASLVTSFKQIAVDQTSDQRRVFDLATVCREVALTLGNRLRREEHELRLEVPEGLALDSFPGPLGQVLTNLIINAMVHGLDGRKGGLLQLQAEALDGERLRLLFSDNGRGISAENIGRIFDPFFTTRLGQGGSGLGLHISYNIVTATLGGSISVRSAPGEGGAIRDRPAARGAARAGGAAVID